MKLKLLSIIFLCSFVKVFSMSAELTDHKGIQELNKRKIAKFIPEQEAWIAQLSIKQEYIDTLHKYLRIFKESVETNKPLEVQEKQHNRYINLKSQIQIQLDMNKLIKHKDFVPSNTWQALEEASSDALHKCKDAMKESTQYNTDRASKALEKFDIIKSRALEIIKTIAKAKKLIEQVKESEKPLLKKVKLKSDLQETTQRTINQLQEAIDEKSLEKLSDAIKRAEWIDANYHANLAIIVVDSFLSNYKSKTPDATIESMESNIQELKRLLGEKHSNSTQELRDTTNKLLLSQKTTLMQIEMNDRHAYSDNEARTRFISLAQAAVNHVDPQDQKTLTDMINELDSNWKETITAIKNIQRNPDLTPQAKLLKIRPVQDQLREHQDHLLKELTREGHPAQHLPRLGAKKAVPALEPLPASAKPPKETPLRLEAKAHAAGDPQPNPTEKTLSRLEITQLIQEGNAETLAKLLDKVPKAQLDKFIHFEVDGGHSLMTLAAAQRNPEVVKVLLDHGMSPTYTGRSGISPIDAANARDNHETALLLHRATQKLKPSSHTDTLSSTLKLEPSRRVSFNPAKTMPVVSENPALTISPEPKPVFQPGATHRSPLHNRTKPPLLPKQDRSLSRDSYYGVGPEEPSLDAEPAPHNGW